MGENKDLVEVITEQLIETGDGRSLADNSIYRIINRMRVSESVHRMGEEAREEILAEVRYRIDKTKRRVLRVRTGMVAASIALLLGVTNYISYNEGYNRLNSQAAEVINPLGMQSSVTLSDGTKVFLNAGTTLRYPTAFVSKNREVEINGEAFFDVSHDTERPFIVKAGNFNVRVLGTKFNVKSYEEEKHIEVTLAEGKVEVGLDGQSHYRSLHPGQQISFDKSTRVFSQKQVNLNHYIAWKEGMFYFDSMTFETISKQLGRRFNVEIHIDSDELKQIVFTGDFIRKESLEQILRVMTIDKRISYKIEGDQVYIQ